MFGRLLALFLITPIVELALLIQMGRHVGFWPTIGLIVLTGVTGTILAKREGLNVWRRFNDRLRGGELPGKELIDGVIILIAAALLVTPGLLTDVAGFLGLIPPSRALIRRMLESRLSGAVNKGRVRLGFGGFETFVAGPERNGDDDLWHGEPREAPGHQRDS